MQKMRIQTLFPRLVILLLGCMFSMGLAGKIDPKLLEKIERDGEANIMIFVKSQHSTVRSLEIANKTLNLQAKVAIWKKNAKEDQNGVLNFLDKLKDSRTGDYSAASNYVSFWVTNTLNIPSASSELIQAIATRKDIESIREEVIAKLPKLPTSPYYSRPRKLKSAVSVGTNQSFSNTQNPQFDDEEWEECTNPDFPWSHENIQVNRVWNISTGKGIRVGLIDTGARYTHYALKDNYLGEYGWFDPYKNTSHPVDTIGHGTFSLGAIVGKFGLGSAPDATWMACRGCRANDMCLESDLLQCAQYFICPNKHCTLRPRIISNSWFANGRVPNFFKDVILRWRQANIIPVFAVGNSGPDCDSVSAPGNLSTVIAVGSTNRVNQVAITSSRGPSFSGRFKPDIVAPGTNIKTVSIESDCAYTTVSGTSLAAPLVAGTISLLLAAHDTLTYQEIYSILTSTTDRIVPNTTPCGNISLTTFPNNVVGYGKINGFKAMNKLLKEYTKPEGDCNKKKPTSP